MQSKEAKIKQRSEKLSYDQQKEKQNQEFLLKHHDILHNDQVYSKKLEIYSMVMAQIAQKDSTYA